MDRLDKINELRYILNQLRVRGAELKKNFSVFERFISQEKFPESKLIDDLNDDFATWISGANKSFEIYRELFNSGKPQSFPELERTLDAEEKKIIAANTFAQAEKFLHLVAKNPDVKKSLEKYQKRLELLLPKKSRDDKAQEKIEAYAKFIEATKEKNSGKKFALAKALSSVFDDDFLGRALIGKEIFFEGEVETPVVPEVLPPTVDFDAILRKRDIYLPPEEFAPFEKIFSMQTCERDREVNAKRFKRDFDSPKVIKIVLLRTLESSGFSPVVIPTESKFPPEHFDGVAQLLVSKGYFQKYIFEGVGYFYSLTQSCFEFLKGEQLKKFFKGIEGAPSVELSTELLVEKEVHQTVARMIYFKIYAVERGQNNFVDDKKFFEQSFRAVFVGRYGRDLVLCCFWDSIEAGNEFLTELDSYLSNFGMIHRVIVGSLNRQHAEKLFVALETALTKNFPKSAHDYVYILSENNFYVRGSEEVIAPADIWKKLPPNPPPEDKPKRGRKKKSDDDNPEDKPPVKRGRRKKSDADISEDKPDDAPVKRGRRKKSVEQVEVGSLFEISNEELGIRNEETPAPVVEEKISQPAQVVEELSIVEVEAEVVDESISDELRPFNEMLLAQKFYCAAAYLKALSLQDETYTPLYNQLAYAINDPLLAISYDSDKIIALFDASETPEEYFLAAATLRTFFSNHNQFDYNMKTLHGIVKNFALLEDNSPLADLIFALMNFKDKAKNGADYYADYRLKNRAQTESKIALLRQEAQTCLHKAKNPTDKAFMPRFIELKKFLFDGSELATYLEYTIEDALDEEIFNSMKNYLQENFIKDGAGLSIENLDNFKFDTVIDNGWREAGKRISKKTNSNLVGELRNNISTSLKTAIRILCERVSCFEESAPLQSEGVIAYKRIRTSLLEDIAKAQEILASKKIAAANVLIATLQEIADKLEGNFKPELHKYFYVDFLRGDKVLLDENYLPNFNFNALDGTNAPITARIVEHARADLPTFAERIKNIFEDRGWDFGSAKLIYAYFKDIGDDTLTAYKLPESIDAAKRIALELKKKFFGFLELAQSYGQFDAAPENTKEKILKLIDRCFEFAQATNNYGVFVRIKEYWENKTKADAAKYAVLVEKNLELGIKNYCRKNSSAENSPALQKTKAQIQKMIDRRNYTVAQGLINRLSEGKLYVEPETTSTKTHLEHFLEDHRDYYQRVSKSGVSLKILVEKNQGFSKAATAKAIKGGGILADNWLPNGIPQNGDVGEDKLKKLLTALGFKVDNVKKTGTIGTDALNYKVTLLPPSNGQTSNYTHPIWIFGSNAEIYGFRLTCLFGSYTPDGLIKIFKDIGDAKDTLVLLDYALAPQDLLSLARKIKAASDIRKTFAVIDRVMMMYLIKNYDAMQINKMLMSLIMPFAAFQPYAVNPNIPMPPEIFIGREREMKRVLDFDDVNIVYGGRQLGKTALLKMACASIDRNENNDRAICVDIINCDCAAAALKISRALRDEKFFDETFSDTDDWTELASAIKKRLASETPDKIPHFMLAIDEADTFLEDCRKVEFKPVLELIDIQKQRHNGSRFKFVMAGLRDVVRFHRSEALGNNNQIAKLPWLVIKPFELEDAIKLLKEPLRYLGLYFSDDENSDSLATMILATTNYFPGLIQLYCAKLIEALSKPDYAGYKDTDSPVYYVKEGHIQSVLSDENFNEQIKNKINMTLRLGDDKFYYVIAHLMAWRDRNDAAIDGYSAKDILKTADDWGLSEELLPKSSEQVEALLKELCELNILRETDKGKYLFVSQRFLNIMGTNEELEAELLSDFSEI